MKMTEKESYRMGLTVLAGALLFWGCGDLSEDKQSGVSVGTTNGLAVTDSTGNPISGAKVYILSDQWLSTKLVGESVILDQYTTDGSGNILPEGYEGEELILEVHFEDKLLLITVENESEGKVELPKSPRLSGNLRVDAGFETTVHLQGSSLVTAIDENGNWDLGNVPIGEYVLFAELKDSSRTWLAPLQTVLITGEEDSVVMDTLEVSPGDFKFEDFDGSQPMYNRMGVNGLQVVWATKTYRDNQVTTLPIMDSLQWIGSGNSNGVYGNALEIDYEIVQDTTTSFIALAMSFSPSFRINGLDSISFWYQSDAVFDFEITKGGTGNIQVDAWIPAASEWTYISITPEMFVSDLARHGLTWEEFYQRIRLIQFESRAKTGSRILIDNITFHGFAAPGLTYVEQ
jgi:hypothetical protein